MIGVSLPTYAQSYSGDSTLSLYDDSAVDDEIYNVNFVVDGVSYKILSLDDHTAAVAPFSEEDECEYSGDVVLPSIVDVSGENFNVVKIADSAFRGSTYLTSVTLSPAIKEIGNMAFATCEWLEWVDLSQVESIGNAAFQNCTSLQEVTIPASVKSIGDHVFSYCGALEIVVFNANVNEISEYAFFNCSSLEDIIVCDTVDSLRNKAFANCTSLKNLELKGKLRSIGDSSFAYCSSLPYFDFYDSIELIADNAFSYCTSLTAIDLTNFRGTLEDGVFSHCSGITEVTLSENMTEIPPYTFSNCSKLENITFPTGMKNISERAFSSCRSLTYLNFGLNMESIGVRAFSGCTSVEKIDFNKDNDVDIADGAFENLSSLPWVYLKGISHIGQSAFAGCVSMDWVEIDAGIQNIDTRAFSNCPKLTKVYAHSEWPPVITINTFDSTTETTATLLVLEGAYQRYSLAAFWNRFVHIEETNSFPLVVDGPLADIRNIEVVDGKLLIDANNSNISIYTLDGLEVVNRAVYGTSMFNLPSGIYIVKCGKETLKIVL